MQNKFISIPSKEHLKVNLSESADKLLLAITTIVEVSSTNVVQIESQSGSISNTFWFKIQSVKSSENEKTEDLYGLPLRELELFDFIIPLSKTIYHVSPLTLQRAKYLKANNVKKFWMRTTSIQALFAALVVLLTLLLGALVFIIDLLNSISQLLG